jgi:hypothetical protein
MNPKLLRKSKGIGADGRFLERVLQMEFYRSSMQVLPADIFASVDFGQYLVQKVIDFYINDNKKKLGYSELLRDGSQLEEHRKYLRNGAYTPTKKNCERIMGIINIRNCCQNKKKVVQMILMSFVPKV